MGSAKYEFDHKFSYTSSIGVTNMMDLWFASSVCAKLGKLSYKSTPFEHNQQRFSYSVLRCATNLFSSSTKLGHGGFGSVHKETLPSG
ncbi:hypothetical protein VIGAN_10071800 [Vigna angularis var. angularis]|uniref:Protein kinase domain-containing protein n=1 Tax=Vigna angularis var. angularis TaxID=157739 RepID=A0A0S3T255_PHAAN|nr:hypothetical protein VIGAN_10071800 [Vigna angularis var. angularis]